MSRDSRRPVSLAAYRKVGIPDLVGLNIPGVFASLGMWRGRRASYNGRATSVRLAQTEQRVRTKIPSSLTMIGLLTLSWSLACGAAGMGDAGGVKSPKKPRAPRNSDGPKSRSWESKQIQDGVSRGAVCNNGEAATYFLREGSGDNADRWIVYLEGGGECSSASECERRRKPLKEPSKSEHPARGVFSDNPSGNPHFHNWNAVFVPYCSSDHWVGDQPASPDNGRHHFRGSRIVRGVLTDLKKTHGLATARQLVLAGGSAGGLGVMHNLDRAAESLPNVQVLGVNDGAYTPVLAFADVSREASERRAGFWNAQPDESCVQELGLVSCLTVTRASLRHIETPLLISKDQSDENALRKHRHRDPGEVRAWGHAVRDELSKRKYAYSSNCGKHVSITSTNFLDRRIQKGGITYTFSDVLAAFVGESEGPTNLVEFE